MKTDELCEKGQRLWNNCILPDLDEDKYKKYVDHIKSCKECQEKLNMDQEQVELLNSIYK